MIDINEVINGLEACASISPECGGCPYNTNSMDCGDRLMADAAILLKRLIPKHPTLELEDALGMMHDYHRPKCSAYEYMRDSDCSRCGDDALNMMHDYHCPTCGAYVYICDSACSRCGQALKWEE